MVASLPDRIANILISFACAAVEEFGDLVPIWSAGTGDVDDGQEELAVLGNVPVDRHDSRSSEIDLRGCWLL